MPRRSKLLGGDARAPVCDGSLPRVTANVLLRALRARDREQLLANARHIQLRKDKTLYLPQDELRDAYFPTSGIFTTTVWMKRGELAEVSTIGHEGMIGIPILLGERRSTTGWAVQSAASAWRIDADSFTRAYLSSPDLQRILQRYIAFRLAIVSQMSACNRLHTLQQRLARWLLICRWSGCTELQVTHEFLSQMLGVQRTTVTSALRSFYKRALIGGSHGRLLVSNASGLEAITCECFDRWLGYLRYFLLSPPSRAY